MPFFSICIPTRNRPETLEYCVLSVLEQDFIDFEIIISDNSDDELSKNIIKKINDNKIKYYKQEQVLPMTDNFEFTVSKANGEFIICIGDDDGLVANSLSYLKRFIEKYDAKVVKCPTISYCWPGSLVNKYSVLTHPIANGVLKVDSKSILEKVFSMELDYFFLPMIYYGAVHKSILEKIKNIQGSVFANSSAVDIYSGLSIAWVSNEFYITDYPFAIMGNSAKSNGTNHHRKNKKENLISKEFVKLGKIDENYSKYKVAKIHHNVTSITWLSLEQFKDNFKVSDNLLKINRSKILFRLNYRSNIIKNKVSNNEVIQSFIDAGFDIEWIDKVLNISKFPTFVPEHYSVVSFFTNHKSIDPILYGIKNVYDASLFCEKLRISSINHYPIYTKKTDLILSKYRKLKILIKKLSRL